MDAKISIKEDYMILNDDALVLMDYPKKIKLGTIGDGTWCTKKVLITGSGNKVFE